MFHTFFEQFFSSQSNPLNNLNIASSLPPLLQRQNSAPSVQPQQINDFYKPNNVNKVTSASSHQQQHHQPELQRKYSLPMNATAASQSFVPPHSSITTSSSYNPPHLTNMIRKQSAPTISSYPATTSSGVQQQPSSTSQQFNNNFQQVVHGSPSRARDRNLFDKVPLNQDALIQIQLPLLKGYPKNLPFCYCIIFLLNYLFDAHFFASCC